VTRHEKKENAALTKRVDPAGCRYRIGEHMNTVTMISLSAAGLFAGIGLTGGGVASVKAAKRYFVCAGLCVAVAVCALAIDHLAVQVSAHEACGAGTPIGRG